MAIKTNQLLVQLGNPDVDFNTKVVAMIDALAAAQQGNAQGIAFAQEAFKRLEAQGADELAAQRAKVLGEILKQLELAPMRPATFIQLSAIGGAAASHALVSLDNGELAYVVAHDQAAAKELKLGDRVMVDAHNKLLMHQSSVDIYSGSEARFERRVDDRHIEVITHQDEKSVVLIGKDLMSEIQSGKVPQGASIILGCGGRIGLRSLPPPDQEIGYFRFLDRGAVPNVLVDRDIGSPPRVIEQVAKHIREEMLRPELRRRFKLRPCITRLLCGVSGTGKTLSVQAIHRQMYEIMSEVTGLPVEGLPHRVFRFRTSQMLSMWLGESDKNADRLFDEVEQVAAKPFKHDGKEFNLPVLVIMEEADGMGRARGEEAIYDRILTTILQRLDPNRSGLSDRLIVFLSTTNESKMVDPAFLRRIGGSIETFGRMNQKAFVEVIRKHVDGLPASNGHSTQKKAWQSIIADIHDWLFLPGGDPGVVELTYQGHSSPVTKYHRDFLTGALIDRSVQQAATEAWELSLAKDPQAGITRDQLLSAINSQVSSVANQLCVQNVSHYLDIPEGVRVANVKRIKH